MEFIFIINIIINLVLVFCIIHIYSYTKHTARITQANSLTSLFAQFSNNEVYRDVKHWVDFGLFDNELQQFDEIKKKKLFNFCHFFDILATLEKNNLFQIDEIKVVFAPYLKALKQNENCTSFLIQYNFKNLHNFLIQNEFSFYKEL